MSILDRIDNPMDLKKLNIEELEALSGEIREFLVENVSATGGHLASSLGVVELTIALHKVFDSPRDKIIWDVGHQAYVHKILTGRRDGFKTLRKYGGLSGFPRGNESEHDAFDAGHASNSVSAALGYVCARDLKGETNKVIAVIGDGAMGGGLAYEGLNNASRLKTNLVVILNNNEMSISENVGGMSKYLNKLRLNPKYVKTKSSVSATVRKIPLAGKHLYKAISRLKSVFRSMVVSSPIFNELGFICFGPVDGHNLEELCEVLERVRDINGPVMIHTYTKKGKGYAPAEENPSVFHGIGKFDPKTGVAVKKSANTLSPSAVFGETLCSLAEKNENVVAITAAMATGTGLCDFKEKYPERFFDVGIAEGHAITFAGGLAKGGAVPVTAIYSTFLQRAYDNIFHDLILQKVHAVIAIDRAGLVGEDGETHHGIFDLSYLCALPEISVLAPSSGAQLQQMLEYAVNTHRGVVAIRYPKALEATTPGEQPFAFGKAAVLCEGSDITLVAEGNMVAHALLAAKLSKYSVEVIDLRTIKPVDGETIKKSVEKTGRLITLEDNTTMGGMGCAVENATGIPATKMGYRDIIVPHGDVETLYKVCGVDAQSVADEIERMCSV